MKLQKGGRDGAAGRGITIKEAKMKVANTHQIVLAGTSLGVRNTFHSIVAILTTLVVVTTVCLRQDGGHLPPKINASGSNSSSSSSSSKCDLFYGKWVFDNESYPLYKEKECTFMSDQLACAKFGRKDLSYQNWRWQPHHCDLTRCVSLLSSSPPLEIIVWSTSPCVHGSGQGFQIEIVFIFYLYNHY